MNETKAGVHNAERKNRVEENDDKALSLYNTKRLALHEALRHQRILDPSS